MCGIAGIFNFNGQPIEGAPTRVREMINRIRYRGPDSQDTYSSPDGCFALGYARLSIVDPDCSITQPLRSKDGRIVIGFNGEIYNYRELREVLIRRGIQFRTRMDTEVLLEGLRLDGESFLERADGMWAFAYYDSEKKRLLLSRDLMGERPLYYRINEELGELVFASEVPPLLYGEERSWNFDFESLVTAVRFNSAPSGKTIISGIERMRPGYNMESSVGSPPRFYRHRMLHPEKWFSFFAEQPSENVVIEKFEELFSRACKRRIPTDVPFVSTLSGGLDSQFICAVASDFGKRRIATLYGESSDTPRRRGNDELDEYQASVHTAKAFGTQHLFVKLNAGRAVVPTLQHIARNGFDCLDQTIAPFELLGQYTREKGFKVILISDGPDEFWGGYELDQQAFQRDLWRSRHRMAYPTLNWLSSIPGMARVANRFGLGGYVAPEGVSYKPFWSTPIHSVCGPEVLRLFFPHEYIKATQTNYGTIDPVYAEVAKALDFTQMRALAYASTSLPDHFNLRTDKAFLHSSVECRVPYQAVEMAEFLIAAPARFRFGDGSTTKYLLRRIVERRIGPQIAWRKKYGFSRPIWKDQVVLEELHLQEVIRSSPLFEDLPFMPNARKTIFLPEYQKLRWQFFVLATMYDNLKNRAYV